LVEDDEAVRCVVQKAFENVGYQVFEAKTSNEGEAVALKNALSRVVTDVVMPNGSGTPMVERLLPEATDASGNS
jgi:DNA-binding response OmpR family regulator